MERRALLRLALAACLAAGGLAAGAESESNGTADASWRSSMKHRRAGHRGFDSEQGKKKAVDVKVYQWRRYPPPAPGDNPNSSASKFREYDELTVQFYTKAKLEYIILRLPERQQCDSSGEVCTGYSFRSTPGKPGNASMGNITGETEVFGCWLRRGLDVGGKKDQMLIEVGDNAKGKKMAFDLASSGAIESCVINNQRGNKLGGTATIAKRSSATLMLSTNTSAWMKFKPGMSMFFTIMIRNAPITPTGRDVLGNIANKFHMVFVEEGGRVLEKVGVPAQSIKSMWYCSYSDWMVTSPCTAKCGGGYRYIVRRRLHSPSPHVDKMLRVNCDEPTSKKERCNDIPCNVDCQLSDWVRWADGPCTATCGGGYEVQRRRVLAGPIGNGLACQLWSDTSRVRYQQCNTEPCPLRCELGNPEKTPPIVEECSEYCGGGEQLQFIPVTRKDFATKDEVCPPKKLVPCNTKPCAAFSLFSGKPGHLPLAGHWFDVVAVFYLKDIAAALELTPPPDFRFAIMDDADECPLISHNLPRLKRCTVMRTDKQGDMRQSAMFEFYNPLENRFEGRNNTKYQVRFWIKNPDVCPGGVDEFGTCLAGKAGNEWTLTTVWHHAGEGDEPLWESIKAGYDLTMHGGPPHHEHAAAEPSQEKAVKQPEEHPAQHAEAAAADMKAGGNDMKALGVTQKGAFIQFDPRERQSTRHRRHEQTHRPSAQ